MTLLERFGTIENYLSFEAVILLREIEKEGYKYYSEAYYKHIDLLSNPEIYMNDAEKSAKEQALQHIAELKERAKGNVHPDVVELMYWDFEKNKEIPPWRVSRYVEEVV